MAWPQLNDAAESFVNRCRAATGCAFAGQRMQVLAAISRGVLDLPVVQHENLCIDHPKDTGMTN